MTAGRVLRPATIDDLDGIMTLESGTFAGDAWSRETMAAELGNAFTAYLVLVDPDHDGDVLGYVGVLASEVSPDADIQTIAVADGERGHGFGRMLVRAAIREAASHGCRHVFLEVRADNPVARALYDSEGFAEIGVRTGYYRPDGVDAVVMRLELGDPADSGAVIPSMDAEGPL